VDRIPKELRNEFERWCKQIPSQPPLEVGKVTIEDALKAHVLLIATFAETQAEGVGGIGPRSMHLLASAIDRQHVGIGSMSKWNDIYEWTATAFFGMVKNHPFHDGNKRTGLLLALWQLYRARRTPTSTQTTFESLAKHTAGSTLDVLDPKRFGSYTRKHSRPDADVRYIADRFRAWTRAENKEFYVVSFSELDRLLRRFGFRLANPNNNYIDVVKMESKRKYLNLIGPRIQIETKVLNIGFPSWKKEVGASTITKVRRATGLVPENGVDSQVFFKELEPMQSLIDLYYEPLRRLADK
jgi:death-on-curing protein